MSDTKPTTNVVIGTPWYDGLMTHVYVTSLLELMAALARLVRAFRDLVTAGGANGATHLLFVDAAIRFEPEAVARLLAFDRDLVAGT